MFDNRKFYVYILSNYKRNVLYIGITNNLIKRVYEHKNNLIKGFSSKYKVHDLLYFEIFNDALTAITREKQLKRWSRIKKNKLITKTNPSLKDLYYTIL